jgi:hypothetical protein
VEGLFSICTEVWTRSVDKSLGTISGHTYGRRVIDRQWRNELRDAATLWLFSHDEPSLASALWRSQIVGMRRLDGNHLGISIVTDSEKDRAVLAAATRSWADSEMPGPLDQAFEQWLPAGDWPVFAFRPATATIEVG